MSQSSTFSLRISRAQILRYYEGRGQFVQVRDEQGRLIQFPASSLRPFVAIDGVRGRFRIRFDAAGKLMEIERLAQPR